MMFVWRVMVGVIVAMYGAVLPPYLIVKRLLRVTMYTIMRMILKKI